MKRFLFGTLEKLERACLMTISSFIVVLLFLRANTLRIELKANVGKLFFASATVKDYTLLLDVLILHGMAVLAFFCSYYIFFFKRKMRGFGEFGVLQSMLLSFVLGGAWMLFSTLVSPAILSVTTDRLATDYVKTGILLVYSSYWIIVGMVFLLGIIVEAFTIQSSTVKNTSI